MFRSKKKLGSLLIAAFLALAAIGPAAHAQASDESKSRTEVVTFASDALAKDSLQGNDELTYKLYLPRGYDSARKEGYPVLYLLHGSWGDETGWDDFWSTLDDMIESGSIESVIAVAPSSGNSYWVNSDKYGAYETAVTRDLIAQVDQSYNTIDSRSGRFLMGYSMGGYGALRYATAYPDLFGAATLLSPAIQRDEAPITSGAVERGSFGEPFDPAQWEASNYPAALQSYAKQENRVPVYIFAGDDDWNHLSEKEDLPADAYKYNMEVQATLLYQELHRKNLFGAEFEKWEEVPANPAELRIIDGAHDTDLWLIGFREGLRYMLGKEPSGELSPAYSSDDYTPVRQGTVTTETAKLAALANDVTDPAQSEMTYRLYTPYGYTPNSPTRYPVLYLLHGSGGKEDSWDKFWPILDALIEQKKIPPVIAAAPVTGNSYWVDSAKFGNVESAIIQDLIPLIDSRYHTIASREGRGLVGFSMGGYGALRYSLTYPELFGGATLLSPAIQDGEAPVTSGAVERGSFGEPFDAKRWEELGYPQALKSYGEKGLPVPMYIIAGDDDWNHLSEKEDLPADANKYNMEMQAVSLYQQLHRANLFGKPYEKWEEVPGSPAELRIVNGGHSMNVWAYGFQEGLDYMFDNGLNGATAGFGDISGHWAEGAIEELAAQGIAAGREEGRFAPEASITRAEFTALLLRALGISGTDGAASGFSDVPADAWYTETAAAGVASGIVQGSNGKFRPDALVTREEMAVFAARALTELKRQAAETASSTENGAVAGQDNVQGSDQAMESASFADSADISAWASNSVAKVTELGLMNGYPDGTFCPERTATRAQAAVMLSRLLALK